MTIMTMGPLCCFKTSKILILIGNFFAVCHTEVEILSIPVSCCISTAFQSGLMHSITQLSIPFLHIIIVAFVTA